MKNQRDPPAAAWVSAVEGIIIGLADGSKPLTNSALAELTDLKPAELMLFDRVWEEIEPKRRRQIIYRLVELAEDNVELNFDGIFKHRLKDPGDEIRAKSIEGLWENEEASFIGPLIELMEQDSSARVREAAATALGRFAALAEHRKLPPEHIPVLSRALLAAVGDGGNPVEVRRRALEAVAPLSLHQVGQAIVEAYDSGSPEMRVSAVYAMGRNCDPVWLDILLRELASDSAELRYEAATACGELGEEEAVARLVALTEDDDADVRLAAVQALGKIGGSEAKECLEMCLSHRSEAVRQVAEQALYELEVLTEPSSIPWLDLRRPG